MSESIKRNVRVYYMVKILLRTMVDADIVCDTLLVSGNLPSVGEEIST